MDAALARGRRGGIRGRGCIVPRRGYVRAFVAKRQNGRWPSGTRRSRTLLVERVRRAALLEAAFEPGRSAAGRCDKIDAALEELAGIPTAAGPAGDRQRGLRLVLRQVAGRRIAAAADRQAVQLLGWLELPLDDAPVLVAHAA